MTFDTAIAGSGIVAVSITGDVARRVVRGADGQAARRGAEGARHRQPARRRFRDPGPHAAVTPSSCARSARPQRRRLPAGDDAATGVTKPWVAIGAHYDHLGHGDSGNSLAGKEEPGKSHPGADDNASGIGGRAGDRGERSSKQPRRRNVLIGFWSGEELGLLGSAAFVAKPPVPLDAARRLLNFDMVGRMQDNKLTVQAIGTSPAWARILEQANVAPDSICTLQADPYQPTDVANFNPAGVPSPELLHRRARRLSQAVRYAPTRSTTRISIASSTLPPPSSRGSTDSTMRRRSRRSISRAAGCGRAGVRVFTGTIPDYTSEVKGLLLGGVVGGGPGRAGRTAEGRRHRRDRRADDRQHLRLHLRARAAEDRPAGEGRLHARRQANRDDN